MRNGILAALGAALGAVALATPALAKDEAPCAKTMVCASDPAGVGAMLMKRGYQGLVGKDAIGDPVVESAANGYKFSVFFYGCEAHAKCDSLQFFASFKNDEKRGVAVANAWNAKKRFAQMAIDEKGSLILRYDVATIGGLTQANFTDVIDWWTTMLGQIDPFFAENPGPGAAAVAPVPKDK